MGWVSAVVWAKGEEKSEGVLGKVRGSSRGLTDISNMLQHIRVRRDANE